MVSWSSRDDDDFDEGTLEWAQPKGALHGAGSSWGRPRVRQCGEAFWVMRVVRPVVGPVGQLAS